MGTTYGGLTGKSKKDFGHGAAWFVPYTNVFDNPVGDSTRLERVEIDPSQNVVRRGDALFTVSSETPEEVGMSSVWPSDLDNLYLNSFCFGYRQDGSFDPSYLAYMLRADSFRNQIEMLAQGISRFNISKGKVMEIEVPVPNKREQARIGRLFVDLDSLITLHQRKRKYRGLYGYLSWEQRKLNEYLETSREKNESCRFDKDDVLSVSGDYGIVNQIEFQGRSYAGASVANYGVVHKGDVVYTKSPLRSNPYGIIKTNRGNDGSVSTLYAVYHPAERTHPDFVEVYFEQNARMNNYMAPLVSKGAKNDMKVSAENALKGAVIFPEIEEQEVIASYFSQLDHLITLHQ